MERKKRRKERKEKKDGERKDKAGRERKRRRLSPPSEHEEEEKDKPDEDQDQVAEADADRGDKPAPPKRQPTPDLPGALPSFPLPRRPDAPSKLDLALQGLDSALANAEVVDPAVTRSVDDASLSEKMRRRLKELGIGELFAVQTALLPFLLPSSPAQRALYMPYDPPRDACVSAPTGSGKTLAYVIPIVEVLASRIVTRLRALVVLPTRDLVAQVRETFEAVGKGRGLKIATATGQHSFAHEQTQLMADRSKPLLGGSSKVDVLICTPGRLIDHLEGTPNFTLQHLRFLVIDEADRLLAQLFQDWLAKVLAATRPPSSLSSAFALSSPSSSVVPHADALAPAFASLLGLSPSSPSGLLTEFDEPKASSCQKLLFSATLTRDPGKLAALALREPRYFVVAGERKRAQGAEEREEEAGKMDGVVDFVMEKFSVPETLEEHYLVTSAAQKPLALMYLVHARGVGADSGGVLVFAKSAEAVARLVKFVEFFEEARVDALPADTGRRRVSVKAYSSDLAPGERRAILEGFKARKIDMLVCSDLVARGMDISHVEHVVSYDAPVDVRKYVHRVGRTARAGRKGCAWSLVEEQEARWFKEMLREADHLARVKHVRVRDEEKKWKELVPFNEAALKRLKETYSR
ncbi:DEAD-domain-containing protein [Punctularia strigosozonata HHB-11173 SS5]|uniref:ATP-dependent RNA helicase n=1 Tax=Punctularia strigosozonata (strain HHB-11173) TaxID=741275 RepID=R7S2F9_PUNST|nr:DEAD-domain-containing protein [Punctularia strigosozonata HHB-11173 SS5]EIN04039.1 DEAD-domain-containing protein [Punctularia strigosozonata HHB-11173 SS5]